MPEYQEILDTEAEPGSPLTSSLGVRFRDNPIAIAQGAAGAPRIQTAALDDESVTPVKFAKISAGDNAFIVAGRVLGGSNTWVLEGAADKTKDFLFAYAKHDGACRIKMYGNSTTGTSGNARWEVLVNGAVVHSEIPSDSFSLHTYDASISKGDSVVVRGRLITNGDVERVRINWIEFAASSHCFPWPSDLEQPGVY